jgi:hypothetical protein
VIYNGVNGFGYSKAKPNCFAAHLAQEQVIVVLDPDIAALFRTSKAVNNALRVLAAVKNLPGKKSKRKQTPCKVVAQLVVTE